MFLPLRVTIFRVRGMAGGMTRGVTNFGIDPGSSGPPAANTRWRNPSPDVTYQPTPPAAPAFRASLLVNIQPPRGRTRFAAAVVHPSVGSCKVDSAMRDGKAGQIQKLVFARCRISSTLP